MVALGNSGTNGALTKHNISPRCEHRRDSSPHHTRIGKGKLHVKASLK